MKPKEAHLFQEEMLGKGQKTEVVTFGEKPTFQTTIANLMVPILNMP